MVSPVSIARFPADFDRWDEVLALIMRAFATMDGVIDPPSSAHRLTIENLRDKARQETGFAALKDGRPSAASLFWSGPTIFMSESSRSIRAFRDWASAGS